MLFVNVDASLGENGAVGVGWYIKTYSDTTGKLYDDVEQGGRRIEEGSTSEEVEYLACIHGVERALRHGDDCVKIVTDCKQLVHKIESRKRVREAGTLRDRLYDALQKFDSWSVKWIPRSSNTVAHNEANDARKRNLYTDSALIGGNESCNIGKQRN